jgi:hypothetical protein
VEASINPFTFELVKKNRDAFKESMMVQQLLDHADYRGEEFGYVVSAFEKEYINETVMEQAKMHLEYTKELLIKLHKYVLSFMG